MSAGEVIDQALGWALSAYKGRYLRWVAESHLFVDVKGLATAGDRTPRLDDVFVDVALVSRAPHAVSGDPLNGIREDPSQRHSIEEFLDRKESVVLAVLGPPGCGKTTLLEHVALATARTRPGHRRVIPVMLALRDHIVAVVADPQILLPELVRSAVRGVSASEPSGWWERQLDSGRCLVLLDGLDEVAREQDRKAISQWVEQQIIRYPDNHFVITSRPYGYSTAQIHRANVVTLLPFTTDQIETFLHNWYSAAERTATGARRGETHAVQMLADSKAEDLLRRLRDNPALGELTVNPLLLTMIANVHRYRGALPGSRADLYAEICQVMLSRRAQAKNLPESLPWTSKEKLLGLLAFRMMCLCVRDLPRGQILSILQSGLDRLRQQITGADLLDEISSNGLLIEREHGIYAFAHLTFQEYLAAHHIQANALLPNLIREVSNDWWRETTLLYAAIGDADPIVRACLDNGTSTALTLAFECSTADHELSLELRQRLDTVLNAAFEDHCDPDHRRTVAAILTAQMAQRTLTAPAGSRVCTRPVSAGLYWLFRKDTQASAPDGLSPPSLDESVPAIGLWAEEALAFTAWVNNIAADAGQPRFRLTTTTELDHLASAEVLTTHLPDAVTCLWTESEPETGVLPWLRPQEPDPHLITGAAVTQAIAEDPTTTSLLFLQQLTLVAALARSLMLHLDKLPMLRHSYGHRPEFSPRQEGLPGRAQVPELIRPSLEGACAIALEFDKALAQFHNLDRQLSRRLALDPNSIRAPQLEPTWSIQDRARKLGYAIHISLHHDVGREVTFDHVPPDLYLDAPSPRQPGPYDASRAPHELDHEELPHTVARDLADALNDALGEFTKTSHTYNADSALQTFALQSMGGPLATAFIQVVSAAQASSQIQTRERYAEALTATAEIADHQDWNAALVADQLAHSVKELYDRRRLPVGPAATHMRLAALSLTHDSSHADAQAFRELPAAITLFQQRQCNQIRPGESIILALV